MTRVSISPYRLVASDIKGLGNAASIRGRKVKFERVLRIIVDAHGQHEQSRRGDIFGRHRHADRFRSALNHLGTVSGYRLNLVYALCQRNVDLGFREPNLAVAHNAVHAEFDSTNTAALIADRIIDMCHRAVWNDRQSGIWGSTACHDGA